MPVRWTNAFNFHQDIFIGTLDSTPVTYTTDFPGLSYEHSGVLLLMFSTNIVGSIVRPPFAFDPDLNLTVQHSGVTLTFGDGTVIDPLMTSTGGVAYTAGKLYHLSIPSGGTLEFTVLYPPRPDGYESADDLIQDGQVLLTLVDLDTNIYEGILPLVTSRSLNVPFTGYDPDSTEVIGQAQAAIGYNTLAIRGTIPAYFSARAGETTFTAHPVAVYCDVGIGGTPKWGRFTLSSGAPVDVFSVGRVQYYPAGYTLYMGLGSADSFTATPVHNPITFRILVYATPPAFGGVLIDSATYTVNLFEEANASYTVPDASLLGISGANFPGACVVVTAQAPAGTTDLAGFTCVVYSSAVSSLLTQISPGQTADFWPSQPVHNYLREVVSVDSDYQFDIDSPLPIEHGQAIYTAGPTSQAPGDVTETILDVPNLGDVTVCYDETHTFNLASYNLWTWSDGPGYAADFSSLFTDSSPYSFPSWIDHNGYHIDVGTMLAPPDAIAFWVTLTYNGGFATFDNFFRFVLQTSPGVAPGIEYTFQPENRADGTTIDSGAIAFTPSATASLSLAFATDTDSPSANATVRLRWLCGSPNTFTSYAIASVTNSSGNGAIVQALIYARPLAGNPTGAATLMFPPISGMLPWTIPDGVTSYRAVTLLKSQQLYNLCLRISNNISGFLSAVTTSTLSPVKDLNTQPVWFRPTGFASEATVESAPGNSDWRDDYASSSGLVQGVVASYHGAAAISAPSTEAANVIAGDPLEPPFLTTVSGVNPQVSTNGIIDGLVVPSTTLYVTGLVGTGSTITGAVGYPGLPVGFGLSAFTYPGTAHADPGISFGKVVGVAGDVSNSNIAMLALTSDGFVYNWGRFGIADRQDTGGRGTSNGDAQFPTLIPTLSNIVDITTMSDGCAALDNQGNVWGWGGNQFGDMGNGHFNGFGTFNANWAPPVLTPTIIATGIRAISGAGTNLVLTTFGGGVLVSGTSLGFGVTGADLVALFGPSPTRPLVFTALPISGVKKAYSGSGGLFFLMNNGTVSVCGNIGANGPTSVATNTIMPCPEFGGGNVDLAPHIQILGGGGFFGNSGLACWALKSDGTMALLGSYYAACGVAGDGVVRSGDANGNAVFTEPNPIVLPEGVTCKVLPNFCSGNVGANSVMGASTVQGCIGSDDQLYVWGSDYTEQLGLRNIPFTGVSAQAAYRQWTPVAVDGFDVVTTICHHQNGSAFTTGPTPSQDFGFESLYAQVTG